MFYPLALNFQNFLTPTSSKIELLFYWTISQILLVALGVFLIIGINYLNGNFYRFEKTVPYYEILWTSLPTLILCTVAIPSMCLLYIHEQESESSLSINCTGHQWYWSYEYSDLSDVELDSFILPTSDLEIGETRYLEVDNRLLIPVNTNISYFISSEDVIHSFALPALSINVDATPARLNIISFSINSVGVFLGQCSELCGANHSFIPIVIESTLPLLFNDWLSLF